MKRRQFIKNGGVLAFGVGVFGNISWTDRAFVGDTATSTDILGPFYRPGAPLRQNLNPPDFQGEVLQLFGTIYKEDGKTPMPNCLVEVWQCWADGLYDTVSNDFTYRGSQQVGRDGKYRFTITKPVPEPVDAASSVFRPAHIHLRISAIGGQDLITQIYFAGDPYLDGGPSTKPPLAVNRILSLKKLQHNESEIRFDVVLKQQYLPDDRLFHDVSGIYKMSNDTVMEFYRNGDLLFYKTDHQIWGALSYAGNNTFVGGANDTEARFELQPQGQATVRFRFIRRRKLELEGTKFLLYEKQG
ncbi:MAG TPA: hypothetical protein VF629_25365 [Hymenobacter sp.]|jgi:protocatechuate 3,4-dioxygenase beta subunit|uniref:dioxygenase family protein n=1 Tax=Hymenobacter sp. TaxID=1898978 RepID=UPI002EDBA3C7